MKITLEVLKQQGASWLDIECFEKFCLYRDKIEFEPMEFVKQGFDNGILEDFDYVLVYKSIDTLEELRDVVDCCVKHYDRKIDLYRTFEFCHAIYKQDVELCKKAMQFYLNGINTFTYSYILRNCGEVLELLPDLHKALKNCVDSLNALDAMLK